MRCEVCGHGKKDNVSPWWYCAIKNCRVSEAYAEKYCPLLLRMSGGIDYTVFVGDTEDYIKVKEDAE